MKRRAVLLLAMASLLTSVNFATAGPLINFLQRPSSASVVVTSTYQGQTTQRVTYPGYVTKLAPQGWINFGYPGTNFPTSRNFGGPGVVNGFNGP